MHVDPKGPALPLDTLIVRSAGSDHLLLLTQANIPARADRAYQLSFIDAAGRGKGNGLFVDPYSGRALGRLSDQRRPLQWARDLHTGKTFGPASKAVDAWSALGLALLSLSGLILWWRTKTFALRAGATGRRLLFDVHNAIGGYLWIVLFVFGATGAMMHWGALTLTAASALTGSDAPPPAPKTSSGCKSGTQSLSPGTLLTAALARAPGAQPTQLQLQGASAPARVQFKYPEDHTSGGRTNVYVDRCSGEVAYAMLTRSAPAGYNIARMWTREIHTGDVFGLASRVIAVVGSLALPVMAITGPWLWLARRARRARYRPLRPTDPERLEDDEAEEPAVAAKV